jgi:hypothetical protein
MALIKLFLASMLMCIGLSAGAEEATQPTPELLEFIGMWATGQGEWFDPSQLEGWERSEDEQGGDEEYDEQD